MIKKIISLFTALVFITLSATCASAASVKGDIDKNGKVDSSDALTVLLYATGSITGIDRTAADLNRDGKINSSDALIILQIAVGLIAPEVNKAEEYVDGLTLEEQIAQMFFSRCPSSNAASLAKKYNIGGYILFARNFQNETKASAKANIQSYQDAVKTPMLIGVDEEGGTVVRVSKYKAFRSGKFKSPQDVFRSGGTDAIVSDTAEKDKLLKSLGINVNLAPVCDVSTNPDDFIYARSFGKNAAETSVFVTNTVTQMNKDKMGCVLKHFPGYGNNVDTHTGIAIDKRPLSTFKNSDFLPFTAGIKADAGAVLVCHNVVNCMDSTYPASLSPEVHRILRQELGFNGVIMTDDLIMDAITKYTNGRNSAVLAVKAGNDMLISSDFETQYKAVLAAVKNGEISESTIYNAAVHVIQWKMNLGIIK